MVHTFDTEDAEKYGLLEAIIISNMKFWITKNIANEVNYFDGRHWTYNSVSAYQKLFPYATERQIRSALSNLIDAGVLIKGNYSEDHRDRTLWYAFSDESAFDKSAALHLTQRANANDTEGKCIDHLNNIYIQTDINTDIYCTEPEKDPATVPDEPKNDNVEKADVAPVILNDGSEWKPSVSEFEEYIKLYPAVDIVQAFNSIRGWCLGNPKKRKTRSGVKRFINTWLSKEQDKYHGESGNYQPMPKVTRKDSIPNKYSDYQ